MKTTREYLQAHWARGVERAAEDAEQPSMLDSDQLNRAAGLHIRSGVSSAAWAVSSACNNTQVCSADCVSLPQS